MQRQLLNQTDVEDERFDVVIGFTQKSPVSACMSIRAACFTLYSVEKWHADGDTKRRHAAYGHVMLNKELYGLLS
ncbi:MAG: hypothetical protein AB7T07_09715 [Steroidobacteraceae bacterium]